MCERSWGWINYRTTTDFLSFSWSWRVVWYLSLFVVRDGYRAEVCSAPRSPPQKKKVKGSFSEYSVTQKVQFHNEQQMGGICRHHLWPITEWWRTFYHSRAVCIHYHTGNQCYTASRVWLFGVGQQKEVKRLIEYAVPLFQDLSRQQSLPVYSAVVLIDCGHIYSRTVLKCRFEVPVLTWVFFFCSLCVIWCLLQF